MRISDEKKALRSEFREMRKNLASKEEYDTEIYKKLINLDVLKNSEIILTYVSTAIEVDTKRLISHYLSEEKIVAVPRCISGNEMVFHEIHSFDDLEETHFSLLEPFENLPVVTDFTKAVCIVPALSFDRECYRLGYGGGYYDRFLASNRMNTVGMCYSENIVEKLPRNDNDVRTDIVVTENEIYGGVYER